ncbi:hypothetical protein FRC00_001721 [Tulasnella sp. 408]|nr:hypothetical protein FRC00_001721 [Tulasnella sp. 408]
MAFEANGIVSFYEDDYGHAVELLEDARNAFARAGARRREAGTAQKMAYMHRDRRQYLEAKRFFSEVGRIWIEIGYEERAVFVDCQAAIVLCMEGAYYDAEAEIIKAQHAFSQLNSRVGIAHAQLGLGHVHRGRSNLSKAEDFYLQSHQVLSRSGDGLSAIAATKGLGHVYRLQGNPDKAEKKYEEVLKFMGQYPDSEVLLGLAATRQSEGRHDEVERLLSEASAVFQKRGWEEDFPDYDHELLSLYRRIKSAAERDDNHYLKHITLLMMIVFAIAVPVFALITIPVWSLGLRAGLLPLPSLA